MSDSTLPSAHPNPQSDIETLYALASLATTASDARSAQSSILATIMASFPTDSGSLSLLSPESGRLEISAQMGLPPETGDFALRPGQGITGWVALHGKPLLAADVSHEPRYIAARAGVCCEMTHITQGLFQAARLIAFFKNAARLGTARACNIRQECPRKPALPHV